MEPAFCGLQRLSVTRAFRGDSRQAMKAPWCRPPFVLQWQLILRGGSGRYCTSAIVDSRNAVTQLLLHLLTLSFCVDSEMYSVQGQSAVCAIVRVTVAVRFT